MATRLSIADFRMSKNGKQTYRRFLSFIKGEYSIEKGKPEEEDKKEVPAMTKAYYIRNQINMNLSDSGLNQEIETLEDLLKKHKLVMNLSKNSVSSNLAILAYYREKKMSME